MENCTFNVQECALLVEKCALLATLWENSFRFGVFGCAERSRRVCFKEYAPGAVMDEVVELQPSFEHLPPLLKPCFPVALCKMLIYVCGDTFGASLVDDRGWPR